MPFSHLFVSKSRKVDFEITLFIQDLTNVPLVSGLYYVKWKIKHASSKHTHGSTMKAPIRDHNIFWGHPVSTIAHLVISSSKDRLLGACELKLEVYQELGGNNKNISSIGSLSINLSEYASAGLITRRYLLDHCKFNSTIKLSIKVDQKSDALTEFNTPPLKRQQLFSNIPTMISDSNHYNKSTQRLFDQRSLNSNNNNNNINNTRTPPTSLQQQSSAHLLKKSQSAISLPHYCRQSSPFDNDSSTDEPSPTDLVEQLFQSTSTRKQQQQESTSSPS